MKTQQFDTSEFKASENVNSSSEPLTAKAIQDWIISYLAELLDIQPDEIDLRTSFENYGLDSAAAVGLTSDLGDLLQCKLSPTLLNDYPTIEALVQMLGNK
jgi:acyl carrier protein